VRAAARWLSILLTVAAAAGAALVLLPAPNQPLALLAVVVDEKTFGLMAAAMLGAGLARAAGSRPWMILQGILALAIVGVALLPPAQALRLSTERRAALDWGRYVTAPVDNAPARPAQTLTYAVVDRRALALDVYRPPAAAGPLPAVIVVHGGGWTAGDKGEAPRASAALAQRGFAVFDVQYRLAPPPTWRDAVGDVKCAVGWVKQHARQAGVDVDPARVFLLGRSAGGHLVLLAAYAPDDKTLPPSCDAGDTSVAGVISLYGASDLLAAWEHPGNPRVFDLPSRMSQYVGATPATAADRYHLLSPIERATKGAPPTLLIHGGRDAFVPVDQAARLAQKLAALGVAHDVLVIPYAQHAFDFVSGGLGQQLAEQAILRFLAAPAAAGGRF
jgi:acetyl esterase/lipase